METTVFMNGQSQAVRIPQSYRLKGTTCEIIKKGDALIIKEKRSISWRQFFDTLHSAPEFEIERNVGTGRKIEL
ncbi:MAG: AbrB/MazE/SpoVT family DNA-binding domain-containing protein [Dysgonamonadaceae bacterium]|jgi:antitoxin VapB|nr:AbrB/MazE/SpoVT family DNA-binding domain-containing protein [Dysgonamonadaceae bacterium]